MDTGFTMYWIQDKMYWIQNLQCTGYRNTMYWIQEYNVLDVQEYNVLDSGIKCTRNRITTYLIPCYVVLDTGIQFTGYRYTKYWIQKYNVLDTVCLSSTMFYNK